MGTFLLTYHGDLASFPEDPAAAGEIHAAWGAWYGSIGENLVDAGAPIGDRSIVTRDGNGGTPDVSGYTIITADDMDAAREIASRCPVLDAGSSVQVSLAIEM